MSAERFREITIPKDRELRIYVPHDEPLARPSDAYGASVRLLLVGELARRAEVFGAPMMPQTRYYLPRGTTVAIFAWTTVTIELCGSEELLGNVRGASYWHIAADSMHVRPLTEYQSMLRDARDEARQRLAAAAPFASPSAGGPRVLICGRESSGKHTAMRTLANYAARQSPPAPTTIIDLSTESQSIGLPGTIGACVAEYPLTVSEAGFDTFPALGYMVGATAIQPTDSPIATSTGGRPISGAAKHFTRLLAEKIGDRLGPSVATLGGPITVHRPLVAAAAGPVAATAGAIITAPNVEGPEGVAYLADVIAWFGVTHVLCIADGRLFAMLQKRVASSNPFQPRFDFLCANPAILGKTTPYRERLNELRCRTHFEGNGIVTFVPIRYQRAHTSLSVWRITVKGGETEADGGKVVPVQCDLKGLKGLAGKLCAVVDLTGAAGTGKSNASMVASSLTTAPVLCYAQMRDADPKEATFLVGAPERVLDSIEHLALVAGEFAYTLQAQR